MSLQRLLSLTNLIRGNNILPELRKVLANFNLLPEALLFIGSARAGDALLSGGINRCVSCIENCIFVEFGSSFLNGSALGWA